MSSINNLQPYVVFTSNRSIYFGRIDPAVATSDATVMTLQNFRHVFRTGTLNDGGAGGVYALAEVGPGPGAKLGGIVSSGVTVRNIANTARCTSEAAQKIEAGTW